MNNKQQKQQLLDQLYASYKDCKNLLVSNGSNRIIFGEGNPDAKLVLIGEAPGAQEDLEGRPFVGRSGKLLNKIFELLEIQREELFITNIVKCRPPNNRKPTSVEIERGRDLLIKQLQIIKPRIICTLGSSALEGLLGKPIAITGMRGKPICWHEFTILPAYHPAYILRNPKELQTLIEDLRHAYQAANRQ